jgi:DNA-binding NarL/FixJ family response regulator
MSGFQVLISLVPRVNSPEMAVIMLSHVDRQLLGELALKNGAQACLLKSQTSGDDLARAIHKAIAKVGAPKNK